MTSRKRAQSSTSPTTAETEIRPQAGPQEQFLATPADIAIYGGAAGGGKTWGLLLEPLRHVERPGFGAVTFRRVSPQIRNEGGLWDESLKLYPLLGGQPTESTLQWRFPSRVKFKFGFLQYDKDVLDWQGSQIAQINFDELTHFSEYQFFYMLSRNRSLCGCAPYVRATTNPDADSWVAEFISWWIDQETGLPIPERVGVLRWFIRVNGVITWADSFEELVPLLPDGLPPEITPRDLIKSVTFIPASVYDNKKLLAVNPQYLGSLLSLPLVERERLLGGNWKIRAEAGKVFNRAWFEIVETAPSGGEECRFFDFAATEAEIAKPDPDYTAGCKIRRVNGAFYVLDALAVQEGPADVERTFLNTVRQDAQAARAYGARYRVRWEQEPASAGKRESFRLVRLLAGIDAKGLPSDGDKLVRARGFASQAEAGNVKLVRGAWNERWLHHMHGQPDLPHNDEMDAGSGAFNELAPMAVGRATQSSYMDE